MIKSGSITYFALSPFCYQQIKKEPFFSSMRLNQLFLPIILNNNTNIFKGKKITFATVGGGNPYKAAELDSLLAHEGLSNYQILVLGGFPKDIKRSKHLIPLQKTGPISRAFFSRVMREVDILLFFYGHEQYTFTQSGAFYEIFQYNTPAIFLKNNNFSWHNSISGPIGTEVDSLRAMANEIRIILSKDINTMNLYLTYKNNIANTRLQLEAFNKACLQQLNLDAVSTIDM